MELDEQNENFDGLPSIYPDKAVAMCPCCGVRPDAPLFEMNCDAMELVELGIGFVFLFKFGLLQICLGSLFTILNIFKIISNIRGSKCTTSTQDIYYTDLGLPHCHNDWSTIHSIANFGLKEEDKLEDFSLLVFIWVLWAGLGFMLIWMKGASKSLNKTQDTPGDWTVMVRRFW